MRSDVEYPPTFELADKLASTAKNEWKLFQNNLNQKFKDEIARICCSLSNSMDTFKKRSNYIR